MELMAAGYGLVEGPLWVAGRGLLFSDVLGGGVYCLDRFGAVTTVFEHRRGIGGMALHAAGGLVVSGRNQVDYRRKYHCCYASRKNTFHYRYSHDQILGRWGDAILQVASVPGVFSSALGDVGYLFRGETVAEIEAIVDTIHASV